MYITKHIRVWLLRTLVNWAQIDRFPGGEVDITEATNSIIYL